MNKNKFGMILLIGSEAVFFTLLILAFLYFRSTFGQDSASMNLLDTLKTGIFSLALFSSSFTIWRAEKNLAKKNHRRVSRWLLATILLGAVFLSGQGMEWNRLIQHGATISRNLFGTTFFTLTGFHGLHVLVGLIILAILFVLTLKGDFSHPSTAASVNVVALYWHFVDLVWVFIFSIVYLGVKL